MNLYWLLKLDDIRDLFTVMAWSLFGITVIAIIVWFVYKTDFDGKLKLKRWMVILVCCVLLFTICLYATYVFLPSSQQMVMLYIAPYILDKKNVKLVAKIPKQILELLGLSLEKVKDLLKTKNKVLKKVGVK